MIKQKFEWNCSFGTFFFYDVLTSQNRTCHGNKISNSMIDNVSFIVLKIIFHGCSNTAPKSEIEIDTVIQQLPPDSQMSTLRIQRTAIAIQ